MPEHGASSPERACRSELAGASLPERASLPGPACRGELSSPERARRGKLAGASLLERVRREFAGASLPAGASSARRSGLSGASLPEQACRSKLVGTSLPQRARLSELGGASSRPSPGQGPETGQGRAIKNSGDRLLPVWTPDFCDTRKSGRHTTRQAARRPTYPWLGDRRKRRRRSPGRASDSNRKI